MRLRLCTRAENPRSTSCHWFILNWWNTVTGHAGHGAFCSRYNKDRHAVGIYMGNRIMSLGITSRARASHTMASWPTAVPWDLEAYVLVRNTSCLTLPAYLSALKPRFHCLIILSQKHFRVFNFHGWRELRKYFNSEQFSNYGISSMM